MTGQSFSRFKIEKTKKKKNQGDFLKDQPNRKGLEALSLGVRGFKPKRLRG